MCQRTGSEAHMRATSTSQRRVRRGRACSNTIEHSAVELCNEPGAQPRNRSAVRFRRQVDERKITSSKIQAQAGGKLATVVLASAAQGFCARHPAGRGKWSVVRLAAEAWHACASEESTHPPIRCNMGTGGAIVFRSMFSQPGVNGNWLDQIRGATPNTDTTTTNTRRRDVVKRIF